MYFCPHLYAPRKTPRSVILPEIDPGQTRLTPEFFVVGILNDMSILSILLNLELGFHRIFDFDYVDDSG
jgi:hypothetical protein